jgi:hypothetical protein
MVLRRRTITLAPRAHALSDRSLKILRLDTLTVSVLQGPQVALVVTVLWIRTRFNVYTYIQGYSPSSAADGMPQRVPRAGQRYALPPQFVQPSVGPCHWVEAKPVASTIPDRKP